MVGLQAVSIKENEGPLAPIIEFYASEGEQYQLREHERIFIATEGTEIVGAVKLCIENGVHMLRTMQVRSDKKRLGIGTQLIQFLAAQLGTHDCFCVPYAHLEMFYGQVGFRKIDEATAPTFLQERLLAYRAKHPERQYLIMMRTTNS